MERWDIRILLNTYKTKAIIVTKSRKMTPYRERHTGFGKMTPNRERHIGLGRMTLNRERHMGL